jgi:hypothetical protein
MKSFILSLIAVVLFLFLLWLDNYLSGGATWLSYVTFFAGFIYVVVVLIGMFRKKKTLNDKARMLLLLLMAGAAVACQRRPQVAQAPEWPAPKMRTDTAGWTFPATAKDVVRK